MGATIDGKSQHWLVTRPFSDDTSFHELGHSVSREISLLFLFHLDEDKLTLIASKQRLFTKWEGEEEAAVNLLLAYVQNVKDNRDLDQAFINSFIRTGLFTIDKAAINWVSRELSYLFLVHLHVHVTLHSSLPCTDDY